MYRRVRVVCVILLVNVGIAWGRPESAPGGADGKGPCVRSCTNANRGCMRQAQLNKLTCRYGCADVQQVYLIACGLKEADPNQISNLFGDGEVDPEASCEQAQQDFDACWGPCRADFSRAARSCVGKLRACYFRQCGIFPPPPNSDN